MKRYKKLGILLTVLVVICIATFALSQYEQAQEETKKSPLIRRAGYLIALRMVNTLPVSGSAPPTFQYENCFHCRYPFYVNLRTS